MLKQLFVKLVTVASLLGALVVGGMSAPSVGAQAGQWIDTSDRAAVLAAYNAEFSKPEPPLEWSGSTAGCDAGTTSASFRQASVDRINFFRQLSGLPASAVEDAGLTAKAAQGALANSANNQLKHAITAGQACYSADANEGAAKSNIATTNGYAAIGLYMDDAASPKTGHRIGLLHPPLKKVGIGDVAGDNPSNAIYWLDDAFAADPAMREADGFVAWPPRGFVPSELVYKRWSFELRGANFDDAQVAITSGGSAVASTVVHRRTTSNGVPFSVITFDVPSAVAKPATDTTYTVSISGVLAAGAAQTFDYDVTVIGGEEAPTPEETVTETSPEIGPSTVKLPAAMEAAATIAELKAAEGFDAIEDEKILVSYNELFEREPDIDGAKYWLELRRNGHDAADLTEHMKDTPEYAPKALVEIYDDVLSRTPDAEGNAYWLEVINGGATRAQVKVWILEGEEYLATKGAMSAILIAQAAAG